MENLVVLFRFCCFALFVFNDLIHKREWESSLIIDRHPKKMHVKTSQCSNQGQDTEKKPKMCLKNGRNDDLNKTVRFFIRHNNEENVLSLVSHRFFEL